MEFFTIKSLENKQNIEPSGIEVMKMGAAFQILENNSDLKTLDKIANLIFVFAENNVFIDPKDTVFWSNAKNIQFAVVNSNHIFKVTEIKDSNNHVYFCAIHEGVLKSNENEINLRNEISKQSLESNDPILSKAIDWLNNGRVGMSSSTMCATLFPQLKNHHKFKNKKDEHGNVEINWPHDNSDFDRCMNFLERIPESRTRLNELKSLSKEWNNLVDKWDAIESLINQNKTDESYKLIQECLNVNKKMTPR